VLSLTALKISLESNFLLQNIILFVSYTIKDALSDKQVDNTDTDSANAQPSMDAGCLTLLPPPQIERQM